MQAPVARSEIVVPVAPHTEGVNEASVTGSPELAVTLATTEPFESDWLLMGLKVMVWFCWPEVLDLPA